MANKVVNLIINLKGNIRSKLAEIRGGLSTVGGAFKKMAKVGVAAFAGLGVAAGLLAVTIKKAFLFETLQTQIKVLVGSMSEAKKVFGELKTFSAKTPFELPGIIEAYRQLKNFTGEALSGIKGLTLVGDAAAATSSDFKETAFWTGRLYSSLKNGSPFLDSVGAMERLGIVGGELRGTLTKMTSEGATLGEMWGLVEKDMSKFEGGMDMLSQTGSGLISTLKDNWSIAVATFGEAFMDAAKGGISEMISKIQELVNNGTITKWAEQASSALDAVVETIKIISGGGEDGKTAITLVANVLKSAIIDGAEAAGKILASYGPKIGRLIYDGFKAAGVSLAEKSTDRYVAETRLRERGQLEKPAAFGRLTNAGEEIYQRNKKKIEDEVAAMNKAVGESTIDTASTIIAETGERTKASLKDLSDFLANKNTKQKETEDAKQTRLTKKAIADILDLERKTKNDLAKKETDAAKEAANIKKQAAEDAAKKEIEAANIAADIRQKLIDSADEEGYGFGSQGRVSRLKSSRIIDDPSGLSKEDRLNALKASGIPFGEDIGRSMSAIGGIGTSAEKTPADQLKTMESLLTEFKELRKIVDDKLGGFQE